MGTRNLICVVQNKKYKVSQYSQWDHNLEGQGSDILKILKDKKFDLDTFKERISKLKKHTKKSLEEIDTACGIDSKNDWITMQQADDREKIAPELSRNTGAKILTLIYKGAVNKMILNVEYAGGSDCFGCEWAYVIDLDKNTFEVYQGYNKEPLTKTDRFFNLQDESSFTSGIFPVKLVLTYQLNDLPTLKQMLVDYKTMHPVEQED